MLFRFYFFFQILLLASFSLPVSPAFAQREDMAIGDQPGVIPNPADEELPLQSRRQVVLYRSSEVAEGRLNRDIYITDRLPRGTPW